MGTSARRGVCAVVASALLLAAGAAAVATSDPMWSQQWGPQQIHAPDAWQVSTGQGVRVGVVDTGVDLNHPDLAGKVAASANCIGGTCQPGGAQDDNGHGTHVSGIIAATANNGVGIAGVAYNARLVVAKALKADGSGDTGDIAAGVRWVVDNGAQVVNLSLGPDVGILNDLTNGLLGTSSAPADLVAAVQYAWDKGAIPVIAAGNNGQSPLGGTTNFGDVNAIVVGATGFDGNPACYSSAVGNAKWAVMAPGGDGGCGNNQIISTWPVGLPGSNGYKGEAGTSMATPHVSGLVALLLAAHHGQQDAVDTVLHTADPLSCGTNCAGRINAGRALGAPATTATVPTSIPVRTTPTSQPPAATATPSPAAPAPAPASAPQPAQSAPATSATSAKVAVSPTTQPPKPAATKAAPPPTTTTTTEAPTTTTSAPPATLPQAQPAASAPASSRALYTSKKGSPVAALAASVFLVGVALTGLAITGRLRARAADPTDLV